MFGGSGGHAAWLEGSQPPDQALNLGPAVKAQSPAALDSQESPSIVKMLWPPERGPVPGPPEHPLPSSSSSSRLLPWWPIPQNPPSSWFPATCPLTYGPICQIWVLQDCRSLIPGLTNHRKSCVLLGGTDTESHDGSRRPAPS